MHLEESVAVRRLFASQLDRIVAAAKLSPPPSAYSLMTGYEEAGAAPRASWRQNLPIVVSALSMLCSWLALLKFDRPLLVSICAGLGICGSAGFLVWYSLGAYRRRKKQRDVVSAQMRRAAIVVRAAELAHELLETKHNEASTSQIIWGVASQDNPRLSDRMNGSIEAVQSVCTVLLSRGATYGDSVYDSLKLSDEARALQSTLARLHHVLVEIVNSWLKTPPTPENKDKASAPYKRYEQFLVEYGKNADQQSWGTDSSPLEIAKSEPLPPFAR